jgi:hypothetical protein
MPTPRRFDRDRPALGRARAAMSRARAVLVDDVIRELRRHDRRSEEDRAAGEAQRPRPRGFRGRLSGR